MNGDDLEENESEEETEGGNQLKKMIKSKTTHSIKNTKTQFELFIFHWKRCIHLWNVGVQLVWTEILYVLYW